MIAVRTTMTTDLYPAYFVACKRCRQNIWITVNTLQFGGDRTGYALVIDSRFGGDDYAQKVYELDLQVAQLRAEGVNATPPGLNLQVLPNKVLCDACKMEYKLASLNRGRRLLDAGAFNCVQCSKEGFCEFEVLEDGVPAVPEERLPKLVQAYRLGIADPETLLALATMRIVIAEDSIAVLDRLCLIPSKVHCAYCGTEQESKLLEPSSLR